MQRKPNSPTNPKRIELTYTELSRLNLLTVHSGVRHATGLIMQTEKPALVCKNGNWFLLIVADPI
jgi:hypothetical protein